MLAGVGSMIWPVASSLRARAKTVLPSAQEEESWLSAPGVEATLLRVSSLPPTSGKLTGGAAFAFDSRAPAELEALLRAVAAYAAGGRAELDRLAARDSGARRLAASLPRLGGPGSRP